MREQKKIKCDICEQEFYLKWRLIKHKEGHEKRLRYCHYFNNDLTCPYEENGCMFALKVSPPCRFKLKCANKLCKFKHTRYTEKEDNGHETVEEEPNEKISDNETDSDVESCDFCGQVFDDIDDLIEHYGITGHNLSESEHYQ